MTDTRRQHAAVTASPWVLDTRAMGLAKRQGPGSLRPVTMLAPASPDTGTAVLEVPAGADVRISGRLESVSEGVLASGTASAEAVGSCARCLREITVQVHAEFRELFAYPDSTTAATTSADEIPRLVDDTIDLEPLVHDELVLAMPLAPTCAPDCAGLCAECGEPFDELSPDHAHDTLDPRWAALAGLLESPTETSHPSTASAQPGEQKVSPGASADDIEEK